MLEALGDELLVVRELAVDEARGDVYVAAFSSASRKSAWFSPMAMSTLPSPSAAAKRATSLNALTGTIACTSPAISLSSARLFDGRAVTVGRDHLEDVTRETQQHARENGPRPVPGRGPSDLTPASRRKGPRPMLRLPSMSKDDVCGKSLAGHEFSENSARPAVTLGGGFAGLKRDGLAGKVPNHIGEETRRDDDVAVLLDRRRERRLDREFHIGREEVEPSVPRLDEHAGEHGERAARRDARERMLSLSTRAVRSTENLMPAPCYY